MSNLLRKYVRSALKVARRNLPKRMPYRHEANMWLMGRIFDSIAADAPPAPEGAARLFYAPMNSDDWEYLGHTVGETKQE